MKRRRLRSFDPSPRVTVAAWVVAGLLLMGLLVGLVVFAVVTSQRLDEADARSAARADQVVELTVQQRELAVAAAENSDVAAALAQQLRRLGERPVAVPSEIPDLEDLRGATGPQGDPGRAPTAGEIRTAVAAYCAGGRCDGQDPTTGQVAAAVASYCNDRGQCRGAAGTNGEDGRDGSDGRAGTPGRDGQDGAPPTQQQINAAVATYCNANGGCRGPQGPEGAAGEPGTPAVPFTFSFTVDLNPVQSRTYTCTVTAPDQTVTCSSEDT